MSTVVATAPQVRGKPALDRDDWLVRVLLVVFGALFLVALVPAPSAESVPYIIASTVIHWGYYLFLAISYRFGDLSFAYPIARGLAPVLIALGATVWVGEHLPVLAWIGVVTVSCGILLLAAVRRADKRAVASALVTSLFIAAYSVVDGIGIRASGSPLGYIAWLFILEITIVIFVLATRFSRVAATPLETLALGFAGGVLSGLAYALALYAKTLAPLGVVSALRETSVIFAALIGILGFRERPIGRRILAAAIVAAGITVLAFA